MYAFLDKFFFVFHSALIVFNLFGWIWRKTRAANLVVVLLYRKLLIKMWRCKMKQLVLAVILIQLISRGIFWQTNVSRL